MNTKHTPAPWTYNGEVIETPNNTPLFYPEQDNCEREANAKLIAAAPELLEALQNLENDDNSIPEHAWQIVQAAIKKATE